MMNRSYGSNRHEDPARPHPTPGPRPNDDPKPPNPPDKPPH